MKKNNLGIGESSSSYSLMIVLMTVVMAIILVAIAYAFDTLVLDHEVPLLDSNLHAIFSDIMKNNV